MDRSKIIEIIRSNKQYSRDEKEIISGIEEAMLELEVAKNAFDNVSDKNLIDICIHKEDEAKSKYTFYLSQARAKNIRVSGNTIVEHLEYYSKW